MTTSVPLITSSNSPTIENEIIVQANGGMVTTNHSEVDQVSKYSLESLQLKSAKFIQSGELDTLEGTLTKLYVLCSLHFTFILLVESKLILCLSNTFDIKCLADSKPCKSLF